jgi:hypothetical protein
MKSAGHYLKLHKLIPLAVLTVGVSACAFAQENVTPQPAPPSSETGAIEFYSSGGFSYGMPANQAVVMSSNGSYAASKPSNFLNALTFGVGVTAWKSLVPFFDIASYSNGKASASTGFDTASISGNATSYTGGLRVNLFGSQSRDRWYVQLGGGIIRQNVTATFDGVSSSSASSVKTVMYGWGGQQFWGHSHHWGSDVGVDGFHTAQPLTNGRQDFVRLRVGIFYQTKSSTH